MTAISPFDQPCRKPDKDRSFIVKFHLKGISGFRDDNTVEEVLDEELGAKRPQGELRSLKGCLIIPQFLHESCPRHNMHVKAFVKAIRHQLNHDL